VLDTNKNVDIEASKPPEAMSSVLKRTSWANKEKRHFSLQKGVGHRSSWVKTHAGVDPPEILKIYGFMWPEYYYSKPRAKQSA
jgi:hypothetical protein